MVDTDTAVFQRQNYGNRLGFGEVPALLIIDFQNAFRDPRMLGSARIADAIRCTERLISVCREVAVPVIYTRHLYSGNGADLGLFAIKVPTQKVLTEQNEASQIVPELAPGHDELVIVKRYPSAFFATDLAALLRLRGIDTLVIAGCSSSGCVHASVVDAMGSGFRPIVVSDCVGDRYDPSHEAALLNIDMKFGDVVGSDEAVENLRLVAARS